MKGFKNTTRTISGHVFPSASNFSNPLAGLPRARKTHFADGGHVGELDEHESDMHGHSQVQRHESSTEELHEGGGKTPLNPGYAHGGKAKEKHFHVHNHYHNGKKMPGKSKLKKMEMMATGGTINKMAKGGKKWIGKAIKHPGKLHRDLHVPEGEKIPASKMKKAEHSKSPAIRREASLAHTLGKMHHATGGHIYDDTTPHAPDYATGGTINRMNAGGAAYGGMATGGTIDRFAGGGMPAAPAQMAAPAMQAIQPHTNANLANLARIAAARGAAHPRPIPGAAPPGRMNIPPAPVSPLMARARGGGISMPMQRAAKQAVSKHVGTAAPRGHAGLGKMLDRK